jgi:lipoate-protein ligase A
MLFSVEGALDGPTNMDRDRALLLKAAAGEVACRVYSWNEAWISLGRFQDPTRDLIPSSIPWVMRPTGGKAVLHGHDATIGLAVSMAQIGCKPRDVKRAYRVVARPIIEALRSCGLRAALAEETSFLGGAASVADCFAVNSPNDIVDEVTGQKVCGCAMAITGGLILVQASIPNGPPLVDPATIFRDPSPNIGPIWDSGSLGAHLEAALRYNFANVCT